MKKMQKKKSRFETLEEIIFHLWSRKTLCQKAFYILVLTALLYVLFFLIQLFSGEEKIDFTLPLVQTSFVLFYMVICAVVVGIISKSISWAVDFGLGAKSKIKPNPELSAPRILMQKGEYEKALLEYRKVIKEFPHRADILSEVADIYLVDLNDRGRALAIYHRITKLPGDDDNNFYILRALEVIENLEGKERAERLRKQNTKMERERKGERGEEEFKFKVLRFVSNIRTVESKMETLIFAGVFFYVIFLLIQLIFSGLSLITLILPPIQTALMLFFLLLYFVITEPSNRKFSNLLIKEKQKPETFRAMKFRQDGKYREAIREFRKLFSQFPENLNFLYEIAEIYRNDLKDKERAIKTYREVAKYPEQGKFTSLIRHSKEIIQELLGKSYIRPDVIETGDTSGDW